MGFRRRLPAPLSLLAILALAAVPAAGQDTGAENNLLMMYRADVAPASVQDFEAGLEGWRERLAEDGETWTWRVVSSITGPPRYMILAPGRRFADLDRDPLVDEDRAAENEEWMTENVSRYIGDATADFMVFRGEVSILGPAEPAPVFWQVAEWERTGSTTQDYLEVMNAWAKVKVALEAANEQAVAAGGEPFYYQVFESVYGEGPGSFLVAVPFQEFGRLDGGDPASFFNVVAATHGHEDAIAIEEVLAAQLEPLRAHLWAARPDLSYEPGGN